MSTNLRKNFDKLELISNIKTPKARQVLLKHFGQDRCFCKAVREVVKNTLKRNIKLSNRDKKKLVKHRTLLLGIAKKRKNYRNTQRLVQQSGTAFFLSILIPLVASLIGDLLSRKQQ